MDDVQILIRKVEELIILLNKHKEENWEKWFSSALKSLKNSNAYGCKKIIDAYGGMGSFSDLIFTTEESEIRRKELATEIYLMASKLWKKFVNANSTVIPPACPGDPCGRYGCPDKPGDDGLG